MSQIKVELQETMGSDRTIAAAAWTSSLDINGKTRRTDEDVERVVKMLIQHKHASPIESVILKFWIRMPIQTDRQHMTHRIASHNGMSGRYRTMPSDFLTVPEDVENIMLSSLEDKGDKILDGYYKLATLANDYYKAIMRQSKEAKLAGTMTNDEYKRCREFFRGLLPQNNMVERVTVMNLRSFANYQKLRNSEHAQPEIRQVAKLMLEAVKAQGIAPVAIAELEKNGWNI